MNKALKKYYKACEELAEEFKKAYFSDAYDDFFWVGDEVGGCFSISDYFFSVADMVTILEVKPDWDRLFDVYYYQVDCYTEGKQPEYSFKYLLQHGVTSDE